MLLPLVPYFSASVDGVQGVIIHLLDRFLSRFLAGSQYLILRGYSQETCFICLNLIVGDVFNYNKLLVMLK